MTDQNRLQRLRAELDLLDQILLDTLKRRIECGVRIAEYKAEHDVPMMQPGRVGLVKERAARFGVENSVDPEFLVNLYEVIIGEMCRVEDLVINSETAR